MKVYFYSYPMIGQDIGGLQMQIYNTKTQLERKNVSVKLFDCWHDSLDDCDIFHAFALTDLSNVRICELAKAKGKKVVISTVFFGQKGVSLYKEKLKSFISKISPALMYQRYLYYRLLNCVDAVIALSSCEKEYLEAAFPCCKGKVYIVPNGIPDEFLHQQWDDKQILADAGINFSDYILHVGQICENKNQLAVLKATEKIACPVVFIGQATQQAYYQKLCEAAKQRSNVYILPPVSNDSKLLGALYRQAKVFVLPSLHEVYPLTIFEAIATDNHIIMTTRSMMGTDFSQYGVSLVAPNDISEMSRLLIEKLEAPAACYSDMDKEQLTWESAIKKLYEIYRKIC